MRKLISTVSVPSVAASFAGIIFRDIVELPAGLIEPGDRIEIDIPQRRLDLAVAEEELARRRAAMAARGAAAWRPAEQRPRKVSTALRAYAAMATSAAKGAVRSVPD